MRPRHLLAAAPAALTLAALSFASPAAAQSRARAADTLAPPRLVLFIAVDQLRPDYFDRWGHQLAGGLGRLWRAGASFPNAFYDHAITETAPGHAVMLSGRHPRSTGIMMNDEGVADPQASLLDSRVAGASPYRFRGAALFDWMRWAWPEARALSVSRKDRGAILPLGRAKQHVYWWAADTGFTTSRYYADTLPAFVREFNRRNPIASFAGRAWRPLLLDSAYREPDADSVEYDKRRITFPHPLPVAQPQLGRELTYDPVMDSLTLALAWDGVRALAIGQGRQPDLLSISLSTTDAVGHRYGPDSKELHDQVLRADRYLGAFLDSLFTVVDSTRVMIALTADHGVAPYPGVGRSYDPVTRDARLIHDGAILAGLRDTLASRGVPRSAVRFDLGLLRVWRDTLRLAGLDADSVTREAVRRLRATDGIALVRSVAELARADTTRDTDARLWLHSIASGEPASHVATLRKWSAWSVSYYANHASPHVYDRRVPVVFAGPWFRRGVREQAIGVVDVAPTLVRALRLPQLERVDGRVVTDALR